LRLPEFSRIFGRDKLLKSEATEIFRKILNKMPRRICDPSGRSNGGVDNARRLINERNP